MERTPVVPGPPPPPLPRSQQGITLLQVMLGLAVLTVFTIMAQPTVERAGMAILRTATISNINEISQAAKSHFIDEVDAGIGDPAAACPSTNYPDACWPANLAELITDGYIGASATLSGYGLDIEVTPNGRTVIVDAQVPDIGQANTVAIAFGGLATVDATDLANIRVQVEYASPGIDAEDQALLDRSGERQMFGPIVFDMDALIARTLATGNLALDLDDRGDIEGVRQLDTNTIGVGNGLAAPPAGGGNVAILGGTAASEQVVISNLGNINAPSGIITTFTSDDIVVNNDIDVDGELRVD